MTPDRWPPLAAGARRPTLPILAALLAALSAGPSLAEGPPEVVRVRVPSARLSNWFPPGTELRGLPIQEFEALVREAREGAARATRRDRPRLLRAKHAARWRDGVLVGRSELLVDGGESGPAALVLEPWTPAVVPGAEGVRSLPDGRTAVRVGPEATRAVAWDWELRARKGSDGRIFALGLPGLDAATLILDVPAGWIPEGPGGLRQGPDPGSAPDRRAWRFDGPGGRVDLRLQSPGGAASGPSAWVGGPTRVEIEDGAARWRAEWSVEASAGGVRRLDVRLDPGLEPIDATGPGVAGFHAEAAEGGALLTIRFHEDALGPTPVTIRARAPVPAEGRWPVPSARPIDAGWTGGETVVRLGPSRSLAGCRERAGRRVPPPAEETTEAPPPGGILLAFDASRPSSVAELTFARPSADAWSEVRGQLLLGEEGPQFEARVSWHASSRHRPDLALELAPGWTTTGVRLEGVPEPIPWRSEATSEGRSRVAIHSLTGPEPAGETVLVLSASGPTGRGPIALPRARPLDSRVADEVWVARAGPEIAAHLVRGIGIAWIDPTAVPPDPALTLPKAEPLLAWRWTDPHGEAEIESGRSVRDPSATLRTLATVGKDRLQLEWIVELRGADLPRALPISFEVPLAEPPRWRSVADDLAIPVPAHPLDEAGRTAAGLPEGGSAWILDLSDTPKERLLLRASLECPWRGEGRIPLPRLPTRVRSGGIVSIVVDRALRSDVSAGGLRSLDTDEVLGRDLGRTGDASSPQNRPRHAFAYEGSGGPLVLRTESLWPAGAGGIIREAALTTMAPTEGPLRHRLALCVEPAGARVLGVTLPSGSMLERVRLDGQALAPTVGAGGAVNIPLPWSLDARPTCAILLDYSDHRGLPAGGRLGPGSPRFSMPCLSLSWEVARPGDWAAEGLGPALLPADTTPPTSWTARILGRWPRFRRARRPTAAETAAMADLDARASATQFEDATLRDCLTAWDAGRSPIVVDRAALSSAGRSPGSRVGRARSGSARSVLEPLGLTVVSVGGVLLITTTEEAPFLADPASADALGRTLREAAGRGSGPADRYQAVALWRDEPTPAGTGSDAGINAPGGRSIRRFAAPGWPDSGVDINPIDLGNRDAWGCVLSLVILTAGILARRLSSMTRAMGLSAILALGLGWAAWVFPRASSWAAAFDCGAFGAAAFWLGRGLRSPRGSGQGPGRAGSSSMPRPSRSALGVARALLVLLAAAGTVRGIASEEPSAGPPIVALIPFEAGPDLSDPGTRVVLRLSDHDRLKAWAEAGRATPSSGLVATSAVHRVRTRGDEVLVESRYELFGEGNRPETWSIPLSEACDVSATLEGRDAPLLVRPGGREAAVVVIGAGRHVLEIRRVGDRRRSRATAQVKIPINPMATARLRVEPAPGFDKIEVRDASGSPRDEGSATELALGPAGDLDVVWKAEGKADRSAPISAVEGALLWEVGVAGDRVHARWTLRRPGDASDIRLGLEPGLLVRSANVPGLVDARIEGPADRPEWVAHVDPPLGDGDSFTVDFWRPGPEPGGGAPTRRLPRIEPLGVERYLGVLKVRRPWESSGRPGMAPGRPLLPDQTFAGIPAAEVEVAAPRARPAVRQVVALRVVPGRIDVHVEANLSSRGGWPAEIDVRIPEALRLVRVEADGLTYWGREEPDLLHLRFDGAEPAKGPVRLDGWLALDSDAARGAPAALEAAIPWPSWIDAEEEPGTLTIESATPFRFPDGKGVVAIVPEGPSRAGLPYRQSSRVDRPEGLGLLRWTSQAAWADVSIRSLLTIDPSSATWGASIRYRVAGPPGDAFRLRLPGPWGDRADLRAEGTSALVSSKAEDGGVVWTIRPKSPGWGSLRVAVRAERPIARGDELDFPDIVPLGQGISETVIALADASGWGIVPGGSSGLQPVPVDRFPLPDFPASAVPIRDAYLVKRDGWSLRIRAGDPAGPDEGEAHVDGADLTCVVSPDGSLVGEAEYECRSKGDRSLTVLLPPGAEAVGASLNGRPTAPLRWSNRRWLIPIGEGRVGGRATVTWRAPATVPARDGRRAIAIPGLTQDRVPTRLTVLAPGTMAVESPGAPWQAAPGGILELERAERLASRIAEGLSEVDRGAPAAVESLVSDLVGFEVRARSASRSMAWGGQEPPSAEAQRQVIRRLGRARSGLAEALEAAGLDDLARSARERVGESATKALRFSSASAPESARCRLRRIGRPSYFRAESLAAGVPPSPRLSEAAPPRPWSRAGSWLMASAVAGIIILAFVSSEVGPRPARLAVAAGSVMILPAIGVEPSTIAALAAVAAAGWASGRS